MSLYNMMCGTNPAAGRLLAAINLDPNTIPRFRDVWANDDLTEVTVHTRTGGGNRESYEAENDALCAHPLYLRDADDDFDCTYADFSFKLPEEEKIKLLAEIADAVKDDPEKTAQVMKAVTTGAREKFDAVMESLKNAKPNAA